MNAIERFCIIQIMQLFFTPVVNKELCACTLIVFHLIGYRLSHFHRTQVTKNYAFPGLSNNPKELLRHPQTVTCNCNWSQFVCQTEFVSLNLDGVSMRTKVRLKKTNERSEKSIDWYIYVTPTPNSHPQLRSQNLVDINSYLGNQSL